MGHGTSLVLKNGITLWSGAFLNAFKPEGPLQTNSCYMLYTIAVILVVLWLLGLVTSYTIGGLIHVLLIIAVIVVLLNVIQGRKAI
jgi:hypothetical protein